MKRKLIVLAGVDGSGKTTQARLLCEWLNRRGTMAEVLWMRGQSYLTTPILKIAKSLLRAPSEAKRGAGIKAGQDYEKYVAAKQSMFRSGLLRAVWRMLAMIDLFISLKVAFSRLHRDVHVVVLDRYIYDSLIDIDSAFGASGTEMQSLLQSRLLKLFPQPQKVLLLEIEPQEAMRRKADIPSVQYIQERHRLYRMLADAIGASTIDATRSIEEVNSAIVSAVEGVLD